MAKKILIVDDEPDLITFYNTLLEENGYETVTAENGEKAVEILKKESPDLIVLDLMMPQKSGVAFYRELRKNRETAEIPVIMVTAFDDTPYPEADFRDKVYEDSVPGPQAYLKKPVDKDLLLENVKKLI